MPCILLFETEYSLEFVYTNLPFLSRPSDNKIETAITWCLQQQKSQKFENVRLWTSIFRYENLKIVSLITSKLFNRNLSIVHPTLFFNSVIAPKGRGGGGGGFPSDWQKAHVVPVHKIGNKQCLNYKTISLLLICSKISERLTYDELFTFFTDNMLISPNQSGFTPGDSCVNQLLAITH